MSVRIRGKDILYTCTVLFYSISVNSQTMVSFECSVKSFIPLFEEHVWRRFKILSSGGTDYQIFVGENLIVNLP